jgi:hypothetical protein
MMRNLMLALGLVFLAVGSAHADTITGTASYGNDIAFFDFAGSEEGASSHWPTSVSFVSGISNVIMAVPPSFGLGFSLADFAGLQANILVGSVSFSGTNGPAGVAVPVTVTGHLVAYHATFADAQLGNPGVPLFVLDLIGVGFGTLHDQLCCNGPYSYADYTYSGTVTALLLTPEPMSFLLLATAAGALGARPGWRWLRTRAR